jgi:hypothetical protein
VHGNPVNAVDPKGLNSLIAYHRSCSTNHILYPTDEDKCRCHCAYVDPGPEYDSCLKMCGDCFLAKASMSSMCECACKTAGVEDKVCEKSCSACEE